MNIFKWWFCSPRYSPIGQSITSFTTGLLFSPWSSGIFYLLITVFIYEFFYYAFTKGEAPYYILYDRCAIICAAFLGYICGRSLAQKEIMYVKIPKFKPDFQDCYDSFKRNCYQSNLETSELLEEIDEEI